MPQRPADDTGDYEADRNPDSSGVTRPDTESGGVADRDAGGTTNTTGGSGSGSTSNSVMDLQIKLNNLGANLDVDGVYGPLTKAAEAKYLTGGGSDSSGSIDQSTSNDDSQLILPGSSELWYNEDTKDWWVVYQVPQVTLTDGSTSSEIYTGWLIPTAEDLTAVVGPGNTAKADFSGSMEEFTKKGLIDLGELEELRDFTNLEGDPFATWVEDMTVMAQVRPWILDDDYIKLVVQAAMERADGAVSLDEIKTTKWWKFNTAAERAWMETYHGDPATAEQLIENNRINTRTQLEAAGINNASDSVVNYMADQLTNGHWSMPVLTGQIVALSDPYGSDKLDSDFIDYMVDEGFTPNQTQDQQDTVRNLLQKWLGPVYGNWSEDEIADKAGELRNDTDAETNFTEFLKDQRMAMYPGYGDREVSYQAAARPWSTFLTDQWGMVPDETDDVFQQVMQANDPTVAGQLARKTGFDRGYEKVVNTMVDGITNGSRSNVIGAT